MRYSPFFMKYYIVRLECWTIEIHLLKEGACFKIINTAWVWKVWWNQKLLNNILKFCMSIQMNGSFHYLNCIRMLKMLCSSKSNFRNTKMIHLEKNKMSFITSHAITNCQFPSSFIAGKTRLYDSGFYYTVWVNNCTNVNKMDGILHGNIILRVL